MTKNSVFFTIHSIQPKDARHFYFHSNKWDSNNLLNYITDPHSFDDIGNKNFNFINNHDKEIFDIKKGNVTFDKLSKPHKESLIFTGLVSFDEELSGSKIYLVHWQDLSQIIFQNFVNNMDFDINDWEMQANMHYNTNNKHIQFRIYQNSATKKENLFKKFFIRKEILNIIKSKISEYIKNHLNSNLINFTHFLKGNSIFNDNKKIKENKKLILDFVNVINLKNIKSKENIELIDKIAELYYSRQFFQPWIETKLKPLNLTLEEKLQIKTIIKNNIYSELFLAIQNNKKQKVFNYISKKDPMDKSQKQKFKNFDKISQEVDFEKVATYQLKTIEMVYKEPFGRFIEMILNKQHYNIMELEKSISNYLVSIRPTLSIKINFNDKALKEQNTYNFDVSDISVLNQLINSTCEDCIKNIIKYKPLIDKYYNKEWYDYWLNKTAQELNLNSKDKEQLKDIIKENILINLKKSIDINSELKTNNLFLNNDKNLSILEISKLPIKEIVNNYKTCYDNLLIYEFNSILINKYDVESQINKYINSQKPNFNKIITFAKPQEFKLKK